MTRLLITLGVALLATPSYAHHPTFARPGFVGARAPFFRPQVNLNVRLDPGLQRALRFQQNVRTYNTGAFFSLGQSYGGASYSLGASYQQPQQILLGFQQNYAAPDPAPVTYQQQALLFSTLAPSCAGASYAPLLAASGCAGASFQQGAGYGGGASFSFRGRFGH